MIVEVAIVSTAVFLLGTVKMALGFASRIDERDRLMEDQQLAVVAAAADKDRVQAERMALLRDPAWCRAQHVSFDARRRLLLERRSRWKATYDGLIGKAQAADVLRNPKDPVSTHLAAYWKELCAVESDLVALEKQAAEVPRYEPAAEVNTRAPPSVSPAMPPSDPKEPA